MNDVIVIGGGAAGMIAAISALESGAKTVLLEKNEKLGKKLFITGKGRCNITNAASPEDVFKNIVTNAKFMYSSLNVFGSGDIVQMLESEGIATKIERGGRIFPASDKSSDVINGLKKRLVRLGADIRLNTRVKDILTEELQGEGECGKCGKRAVGCITDDNVIFRADKIIIATGGLSYPSTGSTGDGYAWAKKCGHGLTDMYPALVPLITKEDTSELQGLSLKNIGVSFYNGEIPTMSEMPSKLIYKDFGEMLFTHCGVSGPVILSASSHTVPFLRNGEVTLLIDLKPAITLEMADKRILREFDMNLNKDLINALDKVLPGRLIRHVISMSGIDPRKKVNAVTGEERRRLVNTMKGMKFHVRCSADYNEAIITKGGVQVKELNPKTMESKIVRGLFFAGEILDVDGLTGGFNLQIAWSTGYAAGHGQQSSPVNKVHP